jgi:hypothetical protein
MSQGFTSGSTLVRIISSAIGGSSNFQHAEIVADSDGIFLLAKYYHGVILLPQNIRTIQSLPINSFKAINRAFMAGASGLAKTRRLRFRYFFLIGFNGSPAVAGWTTDSINPKIDIFG